MSKQKPPLLYRNFGYRPAPTSRPATASARRPVGRYAVMLLVCLAIGFWVLRPHDKPAADSSATATAKAGAVATECQSNTAAREVLVSISQRHLWACAGRRVAYDSPVVTGMAWLAADKTPTGTYHIYGKYTDTTLTGRDSTGSWSDPVDYWLPWLHNKYGTYGFHDAQWRADDDFGSISPDSKNASHGCVELPLATARWLYDWAAIGTTVKIVG